MTAGWLNATLTLKCEAREGLAINAPAPAPPESEAPAAVNPQAKADEDFKNDPKIKKALEIFEAEILPA